MKDLRTLDLFVPYEFRDPVTRRWLASPGTLLLLMACAAVIVIWVLQKPASLSDPWRALAKFSAFNAISLLSLNFVLSVRARWMERLFNGMDRQYIVHRLTGRAAVLFMLLHPIFLLAHNSFSLEALRTYLVPGVDWPVSLGTLSFVIVCVLIALTMMFRIPYHIWFITHRFMIFVLVLSFVHAVLSGSDVGAYPVMMGALSILFAMGVTSDLYMAFFYRPLNSRKVKVLRKSSFSDILELKLMRPHGFNMEPGQFIFVQFPKVARCEFFPFSISSDQYEDHIRISIKAAGDTTSRLKDAVRKDDVLRILGPYGMFGKNYMSHDRDMIWVAGGIGITPFLSMAMNESIHPTGRRIDLIYAMRGMDDAHYDRELHRESSINRLFNYMHWLSMERGRISAEGIVREIEGDVRDRVVMICGPPAMMEALSSQFRKLGVPTRNIIYEDFNLLGH
ncbi:MAG: ferric reductase-like transmembrane domain-containing protein [Candidatus Thermoplasmatota archaeon]|nr:ferric reductase-like transmembrane domain-containing protein [Candidatus Thermoplasmatota archaeon]